MIEPRQIVDAEFEEVVLHSKVPVIVYFWVPEHGVSAPVSDVLQRAVQRYGCEVLAVKIDVSANSIWSQKLGIQYAPSLVFFSNGKELNRAVATVSPLAAKIHITAFMSVA